VPPRAKDPAPSIDEQLAALESLPADRAEQLRQLERALGDRHYRVVAKAARLAEDGLLYDLVPALLAVYPRFLDKPVKSDPNCLAKKAITRALVALDCDDTQFFTRGLAYRQPEPVWGGTRDTAADVRSACAMGLVATGYPRALVELTTLLNDAEAEARLGAARAIACGNPRDAELLLRSKVLAGDAEPAVLGECFTGLLGVEPDESLAFVAEFLRHPDEAVQELAALALGESRLDAALPPLQQAWNEVLVGETLRRTLLRAITAHRSEKALEWLLALVAAARPAMAVEIIEALALYKHNAKLAERLESVLAQRGEGRLLARFEELWGKAPEA
jgi:HEAT repeat protein